MWTGFAETGVANAVLRVASKLGRHHQGWHGTRTEDIRIRVYQEPANQVIVRSFMCSFRLAAILLLANAIGANAQAPTAQIDRVLFVPLGGIDQWISIRGDDRANPVLLVVHGGPGEAQWPQAEIYRPSEKSFPVVQWDQRGAGHTFGRYDTKTPDVTLDRISKDGVELAEYLCRADRIGPHHALASAAIPLLFPPVRIDGELHLDGGLRQNTPIAPALRLGATHIFAIGSSREVSGRVVREAGHTRRRARRARRSCSGRCSTRFFSTTSMSTSSS